MRRILIAVFVILVAWIALKDLSLSAILGTSEIVPEEPDYFFEEVWLDRPAEMPAGGWETPWGVDVFVIAPPVTSPVRKGSLPADSGELKEEYLRFADAASFPDDLTIYAPAYRSPSPASDKTVRSQEFILAASDLRAALQRYLTSENRERGLLIMAGPGTEPMLETLLDVLPKSDGFRERFAGVMFPVGTDPEAWSAAIGHCSPAFAACAVHAPLRASKSPLRYVLPRLSNPKLHYAADPEITDTAKSRAEALSAWLDLNAEKPAEPFDSWAADEVVDVAPIRRPNQDEDISGDRGD